MFGKKEEPKKSKKSDEKKAEEMLERGYSDFFLYLIEITELLISKGHNTEFRNPYNYPIRTLLAKAQIISSIDDKQKAIQAQINLTTNIASSGWGGKEAGKHFKEMIEKLYGE